jgi:hypothetical protein
VKRDEPTAVLVAQLGSTARTIVKRCSISQAAFGVVLRFCRRATSGGAI